MGNKQFFVLIFLLLGVFAVLVIYDVRTDSASVRNESVIREFLIGTDGSAAQIQYLFHFPDPFYIHNMDTAQLEALRPREAEAEHYHVYGLTQASYKMDALYEFNWSKKWFK